MSQNEHKTDLKKSQICPIRFQSGQIKGQMWHPWFVNVDKHPDIDQIITMISDQTYRLEITHKWTTVQ